ncbi:hypothetical protein L1987_08009 [Smallanthus sonchifolius]|uniref:Uncharacterized protein n=1 Tax=Smallanthus sonchifolius TaxID=185202 RepID=A0ACB9JJE8_9ASTR|nr:hypothetical protein L1987_08009 [Smallanthus sonchifolius]
MVFRTGQEDVLDQASKETVFNLPLYKCLFDHSTSIHSVNEEALVILDMSRDCFQPGFKPNFIHINAGVKIGRLSSITSVRITLL